MVFVNVYTVAACFGRFLAQADWLAPKVTSHVVMFCILQMNLIQLIELLQWL